MAGKIFRWIGYIVCLVVMVAAIGNQSHYLTYISTSSPGWTNGPKFVQEHLYLTCLYILAAGFCMFMIAYTNKRKQ